MESTFARLGRAAAKQRWLVIAVWVCLLAFGAYFSPKVEHVLQGGGWVIPSMEAVRASDLVQERFAQPTYYDLTIVYHSDKLLVTDADFRKEVDLSLAHVKLGPQDILISPYDQDQGSMMVSADRHSAMARVRLQSDFDQAMNRTPVIMNQVRAIQSADVQAYVTGDTAVYTDMSQESSSGLRQAETYALPLALLVLLVAFGSVVAAGVPVVMGLVSVSITLGVIYFLAQITPMSIFVSNITTMIGLGVGIDYSLFILTRFRDEMRRGGDVYRSIERTMATSGRAVAFSGLTVMIALSALFLIDNQVARSVATGAIIVVAVAVVAALTLLPAVLAALGSRVNALSLRFRRREGARTGGFWRSWALQVMKRPVLFLTVSALILIALALPMTSMREENSGVSILPPDAPSRQGYEIINRDFGAGAIAPIYIVMHTGPDGAFKADTVAGVFALSQRLKADPEIASVASMVDLGIRADMTLEQYQKLYANGAQGLPPLPQMRQEVAQMVNLDRGSDTVIVKAFAKVAPDSDAARNLITRIRTQILPATVGGVTDQALVTGSTASNMDFSSELSHYLLPVILVVLILTYIVLVILFRSVFVPLKAVIMNALSVAASYGFLVLVFQMGYGHSLLGFDTLGHLEPIIPVSLFCILFGLSMDYEVFLVSRIRESYEATGNNEESVATGLERTAGVITSAALIMVVVFSSFAIVGLVTVKQFGAGLAVAVALDATLVRLLLVPATMRLLGKWNWWLPQVLRDRLPQVETP